jgi:hypothetical protein
MEFNKAEASHASEVSVAPTPTVNAQQQYGDLGALLTQR